MNQQNNQMDNMNYQQYDDEIDLGQLFRKIWLRKAFIFSFVFLIVVSVVGVLSAKFFIKPPVKEYSRILQFNFASSTNGKYPSGQKFIVSDVLSARILDKIYSINSLEDKGLDKEDFLYAFSVSPYGSNIEFIEKKFIKLLENKKLTRPEIEALEKEYLRQLNAARSRFVKIAYIESSLLGLDKSLIDKILLDIPKIWSDIAINEMGVLNLKFAGSSFYQANEINRFEYIKTLNYLKNSADKLGKALSNLTSDKVGGSIKNPKTGKTVYDLKLQLQNLEKYDIQPLFSTFTNLGIAKSKFKAKLYLQNTIQNLEDKKIVLNQKQNNYKTILETYANDYSTNNIGKSRVSSDGAGFAQFDAGFFDKITAMIEGRSDTKYKQSLLEKRLAVMQQVEEVDGELLKLNRALKMIKVNNKKENLSKEVIDSYIGDISFVDQQLSKLVVEYQEMLSYRNKQVLGDGSALYSFVSTEMAVQTGFKGFIKSLILFSALATFLSLMIAVMIALIKKLPEEKGDSD